MRIRSHTKTQRAQRELSRYKRDLQPGAHSQAMQNRRVTNATYNLRPQPGYAVTTTLSPSPPAAV